MKTIKINKCLNCPFVHLNRDDDAFCQFDTIVNEIINTIQQEIEDYETTPSWCPLQNESVEVVLDKNKFGGAFICETPPSEVFCPHCKYKMPDEDILPTWEKSTRGKIRKKCQRCRKQIGISMDYKGNFVANKLKSNL